jgi:hypothetical protein
MPGVYPAKKFCDIGHRSPVHSASDELQKICKERDTSFDNLREVYFNEDSDQASIL